ncbi:MAG TPA: NIPSNAP family protein [Vicinamibacterales bacterium]|jgi:hypothetical protein|nr:NIPSNAP family protein [Vicinamibacterales bacterium]
MKIRCASLAASLFLVFATGSFAQNSGANQQAPTSQAPSASGGAEAPTPPCGPNLAAQIKNVANNSRCFELRMYTVQPGSSMDLLHSRFREHTTALFIKHGMTVIGYWQPVAKPNVLVYMLAYKDAAARDASWAAFRADPEWVKTRAAMAVTVQVDNTFMSATDYSPMK